MNIRIRRYFGLPVDPWADLSLDTADMVRAMEMVRAAAEARAMVFILGQRGTGKSHAVWSSISRLGAQVVEPLRLDRERLHLGDIQAALVRDLSAETLRRSGEARSGQVRRVLLSARQNVVLVLDDCHCLHPNTLRGLKRLRELGARGRCLPSLGVILLGQADRAERLPEIGLRSDRLWLAGLTVDDAALALEQAINAQRPLLEPEALTRMSQAPAARTWLDLQQLADDCLSEAAVQGKNQVDLACVTAVLAPGSTQDAAPAVAPESAAPSDGAVSAVLSRRVA